MGAPLKGPLTLLPDSLGGPDGELPFPETVPGLCAPPARDTPPASDTAEDVSFEVRSTVLERLARGAPLEEILELLARQIERHDVTVQVAILLLRDGDGAARLHAASAPSLPREYSLAIDGAPIGPTTGSCGSAAYWGERVIVSDIARDPLWRDYRELALRHGLRACWSQPINASNGQVLGTLAMYYRSVREPSESDLQAIAEAANLASIAIERKRADERIARLTSLYRARSEISHYIVQAPGEEELLAAVCRVAVEFGGMRMAWIGRPDPDTRRMEPLARYGQGQEYIDTVTVTAAADTPEGRGPGGRAYRSGECVIVNDFEVHGGADPWRRLAAQFQFRSVGCFPIHRGAAVFAVLGVYSERKDSFDSEAISLLRQTTRDLGYALDGMDRTRERNTALRDLRHSEQHFRAYFDRSMVGMAATDLEKRWIEVNDALCAMFGYTREEMLARTWAELTHPEDLAEDEARWEDLRTGRAEEYDGEKRYLHKDGHTVHARIAGRAVRKAGGALDYIVLIVKDTSEPKRTAQALLEKNAFLESILRSEPECVTVVDHDGTLLQMNEAGLHMFAVRTVEEMRDSGLVGFLLPKYRRAFLDLHARVCKGGKGVLEFQARAADGTIRWLEMHATPLRDSAGHVSALLGIVRDISDKKHSAELIWKQANFDLLTGLPNRYMFQDRLAQEIKKAHRSGSLLGLLFIDLDYFKEVNDTLGHETGDALLIAVAQRISACVREADTVARLGGDEFTVILPTLPDTAAAEVSAQNIITRLGEVFTIRGESIVLSASIGITYFPSDAKTVDGLLKNADQAMYVAKRQGRNRVGYFTATLQEEAQNRLRLINDLRGALAANQFRVYFQAVVDLTTQRICGAEALVRWQHPKRGLVSPAEFIPLAEDTGLIIAIGDWVFREAARWAKRWVSRHGADFQVSVNNSPVQFRDPGLLLAWPQYLEELQLPGRNMTIEITEGLLLDADAGTTSVLRRLRDSGMRVSIDDFGTGYSSLSYLHKFQIDTLKIDQSFVRNLVSEPGANALSESIIVMGHKLGLTVVAEGVETAAQRDFLITAGCDSAQGYLFSRPIPPEEFDALLQGGLGMRQGATDIDVT
jgi:diguanylate cyclase (GGDEF)-like protein/PAS domain S-box-containing protein